MGFKLRNNKTLSKSVYGLSLGNIFTHVAFAAVAFQLGVQTGFQRASSIVCEKTERALQTKTSKADFTKSREYTELLKQVDAALAKIDTNPCDCTKLLNSADHQYTDLSSSIRSLFGGVARVSRDNFTKEYDLGVPWDETENGAQDVLLFYSSMYAMPPSYSAVMRERKNESGWPPVYYSSVEAATENCETLKVILTKPKRKKECLAIVPQWESYHVHNFMRWKDDKHLNNRKIPAVDMRHKLKHVSRHHQTKGTTPRIPSNAQTLRYLPMLLDYILKMSATLKRLKPVVDEIVARNKDPKNVIVVMVCNFGQSELFLNFVCSAKSRGLDLSKILLFATDKEMYNLAKSIEEISVFDVDDAFGENVPKTAAGKYGDKTFQGMMFSKVYCVHLINYLGYDVLFQDVDVVWYKNPLEYFEDTEQSGLFDFYFQDDGAHSNRYLPYSPNSGFYFVRNNARTRYFFNVFMRLGDQIMVSSSHQAPLNDLLSDHSSTTGLRVKVFARDSPEGLDFPGGFHFHQRKNFMKDLFLGNRHPYIFHMSWTQNKENKRRFLEQMGDWFIKEQCVSKEITAIHGAESDFIGSCCSADALFVCHYRDKPSKYPCKKSPNLDRFRAPFWE